MNVILNNRLPAIQISDTEFKYLTGTELVGIIQDKNLQIEILTKEIEDLKVKLATPKVKKGKTDDNSNSI